jgi:hypothetical protein
MNKQAFYLQLQFHIADSVLGADPPLSINFLCFSEHFNARVESLRATLPAEIFYWGL